MAKKSSIETLAADIRKILAEYGDDIAENMAEVTRELGKKGAKAVRAGARSSVKGKDYASGWTSQFEQGRLSSKATIYNRNEPHLAHLLEHGHVSRNGTGRTFGTVPGREHIAPVEKDLIAEYKRQIERAVKEAANG